MAFCVTVQFGKDAHKLEMEDNASVADLGLILEEKLGILSRNQKLIYRGKVLQPGKTLAEFGVKKGGKIMLLASAGVESRGQSAMKISNKERLEAAKARAEKVLREKSKISAISNSSLPVASLEDQAKIWEKLKLVSLRDRKLTSMPPQAFVPGAAIEAVDISLNKISSLSDGFRSLVNLRRLRATHNCLTSSGLGEGLFSLTSIVQLDLSSNNIEVLPDAVGNLVNLKHLSLAENALEALPSTLLNLSSLLVLDVSQNSIKELPQEISECHCLLHLHARRNLIAEIPPTFVALKELKTLILDHNRVRLVPSEILMECTSLAMISLHENPITMEELREIDGFDIYEARRRNAYDKKIDMDVLQDGGFDEGVDFMRWER